MSALDHLTEVFDEAGHPDAAARQYAAELLAEHAHELAEKIREKAQPSEGGEWDLGNGGMEDAADLIDPKSSYRPQWAPTT